MKSEEWFPTKVWYDNLEVDLNQLQDYCLSLDNGVEVSNVGGFQSQTRNGNDYPEQFKTLFEEALKRAKLIGEEYDLLDSAEVVLINWWVNVNHKGNYNVLHTHPHAFLSSCFYVKNEDPESKIEFVDPRVRKEGYQYNGDYKQLNNLTYGRVLYDSTPGKLLVFPSWLEHRVYPNMSDEPRISIAFNFGILHGSD